MDYDKVVCERMQGVVLSSFLIEAAVLLINLSLSHTSKCMQTNKAAWGSEGQQCRWLVGLFGTGSARTPQPRVPFRNEAELNVWALTSESIVILMVLIYADLHRVTASEHARAVLVLGLRGPLMKKLEINY